MDLSFIKNLDLIKFIWTALLLPVFGWIIYLIKLRIGKIKRKKRIIHFLKGLPFEAKSVIAEFYLQNKHTLNGDPYHPPVDYLVRNKIIIVGPGAGGYSAVNRYLTIREDVWISLAEWISIDDEAFEIITANQEN